MRKLGLVISLLTAIHLNAQNITFIKSYGNSGYDVAKDVKQDLDTGYIATGSSSSFVSAQADAFLLKVDSLGNFKWSYNYGGEGSEWGEKVIITNDSAYALAGYTNSIGNGGFDFYLVKTNSEGTVEFEKSYGGTDWDKAHGLVQMPDSGYVMVGETYSYGSGGTDAYIIRTNKNGDTLWTRVFGGPEDDYANDVLIDGDSIVVVGGTESFGAGMADGLILKYHMDGTLGWSQVNGKEREDYYTSIVKNTSGEYFLGGTRHYYFDQTGWLGDFWIYNITSDGQILNADTSMTGGTHELEIAHDIAIDDNDNIFWAGETKSFGYSTIDNEKDAYLGKLLNNYYEGNYIKNFGEAGEDVAYGMDICYDLGIVACGNLHFASTGGNNMFIARVDRFNTVGLFYVTTDIITDNITLSYDELIATDELKLYPTLVDDLITLEGFNQDPEIKIYNSIGQLVNQPAVNGSQINVSILSPGFYISLITYENQTFTHRFYKN